MSKQSTTVSYIVRERERKRASEVDKEKHFNFQFAVKLRNFILFHFHLYSAAAAVYMLACSLPSAGHVGSEKEEASRGKKIDDEE
jgi:hypothetical protein